MCYVKNIIWDVIISYRFIEMYLLSGIIYCFKVLKVNKFDTVSYKIVAIGRSESVVR